MEKTKRNSWIRKVRENNEFDKYKNNIFWILFEGLRIDIWKFYEK